MAGYGDFAYYYDLLTENVDYESRCEYICNLLAENGVSKGILLDLACGTGTMSMLLSDKGYDVIGVDASEDMLSVAQEKKMESGKDIMFLCQRMEELDLFGTINAAVCTLDSINHITDEKTVQQVFSKVSLFMEDKGIFLFDVNTPYKHREVLGDNTFIYDMDDVYCVWQNSTDKKTLLTEVSLDIFEKDTEEEEDVYYRYSEEFSEKGYELSQIEKWLTEYKFEVLGVYEELSKNKVGEKTQRAVFVARKHGTQ
ncbi:MAG: class I SAM-dependent methyltransferase [Clostridia bacterium]|nr:class I SAM-dependent methyltransferase [Clostridia bacterium]MBQ1996107.1 class I SAM-dependent methyltransferase [Clostridia bacterium]MBQ5905953.1 class I SAM-dependent methyltransferase [Clostridia bacterium]